MKVNIDELMSRIIEPWDLWLTIDGRDYPTRELQVADWMQFAQFNTIAPDQRRAFINSLVEGDARPDLTAMSAEKLMAIGVTISTYFAGRIEKKSRSIAAEVRVAMGLKPPSPAPKTPPPIPSSSSSRS